MSRAGKLFVAVLLIVVLEGALRKWVSSSLTLPLVLLRDLLAIYTVWYAIRRGALSFSRLPAQLLLVWSGLLITWGLVQIVVNQSSPEVLLIGLRFWLLYLWFGYAAAISMTALDYRRSIQVVLVLLILMTPLVVLQQRSPPGALINLQLDTDERDIFVVVAGIVRPTGTFSFTLGYTTFLALALPAAFAYPRLAPRSGSTRLLFALAFASLLVGTILSGSRAAIILYGVMLGGYLLGSMWFSRGATKLYALAGLVLSGLLLAGASLVFGDAVEATQQRFEAASEAENLGERITAIFAGEPETYNRMTWLGHGLGSGSNLAGYFQTGERSFLLAETESARTLLEGGLMGAMFILAKLAIALVGLLAAWRVAARSGSPSPLLVWLTLAVALATWSAIGQLTVNAAIGLLLAFGVLALRFAPAAIAPAARGLRIGAAEAIAARRIDRPARPA
ncbi:MAG: hypothetical protein JSR41_23885 [Proteobacteria bacterium]|nr:hypothetical protein [Pseudomonadota bacterium]